MTMSAKVSPSSLRRRWNSIQAREVRLAWAFILPTALIVFGLVVFPAIFSIWISFHDVGLKNLNDVFRAPSVGLENYRRVLNDFAFKFQGLQSWGAAVTSIVYSFSSTILTLIVGLVAALLLNRPFRARGLARAVFLFPYVAPIVSVAFVWRWILDPRPSGVLNDVLMRLGAIQAPKAYLAMPGRLPLLLVIVFEAWRYFPFAMLMILARLQAVDTTLYEAADVDGAKRPPT
jgi:multiple sugar transport system permease protein